MKPKNYSYSINVLSPCLASSNLGFTLVALFFVSSLMAQNLPELVSSDAINPKYLTEYNDQLFFNAEGSDGKKRLWSTDGTTTYIRSYGATANYPGSQPHELTVFNNQLILTSVLNEGGTYNRELFEFDGTGPSLIKNIYGSGESNPKGFTEFNGSLYFSADDGMNGNELWVTDGTEIGTQLFKDINPGSANSYPIIYDGSIEYDGKLIFNAADDTYGIELWITDGTSNGTNLLKDINPGSSPSIPAGFMVFDNKVYFNAADDSHGSELWVTDGTQSGTQLLKDINPQGSSNASYPVAVYDGQLYFIANEALWVTDGTENGTTLFMNLEPRYGSFKEFNGKLYFGAKDDNGSGLWVTDGTVANTVKVKTTSDRPENTFIYDGRLYFTADDGTNGRQLWVSDGTMAGTDVIMPAVASNNDPVTNGFESAIVDNTLYYTADYDGNGVVLWKLTTNNLSVKNYITSDFKVYPNPVQDILHVTAKSGNIQKIDLLSITGQRLKTLEGQDEINLSQVATGSYFVKITTDNDRTEIKQIIKK